MCLINIVMPEIPYYYLVTTVLLYCIYYCHHSWNSQIISDFNVILMWIMSYSAHYTYLILMYMSCCTKFQICYYILVLGHPTLMSAFLFKHYRPVCSLFLMTSVLLPAPLIGECSLSFQTCEGVQQLFFFLLGKLTFVHECIFSQISMSDPVSFFPPIQVLLLWKWATFWQIPHPLQPYLINLKFFLHLVSFLGLGAFHTECYRGHPAALDSLVFCLIHVLVVLVTWVQS